MGCINGLAIIYLADNQRVLLISSVASATASFLSTTSTAATSTTTSSSAGVDFSSCALQKLAESVIKVGFLTCVRFQRVSDDLRFSSSSARWTSVFNFDRNSSTFLVVPLLLVVSLLISSLLDFVVCLSLNTVVLVLRRLSRWCSSSFFLRGLLGNCCLFLSRSERLLQLLVRVVDSFDRLLKSCPSLVQSVDRRFLSYSLLRSGFLLERFFRSLGFLLRRLLLGLILFRLLGTVLFWLLAGLVPLGGSLVRLGIGLIAGAFGATLWLLPGASCSFFSWTIWTLTLVLGLGSLDNVV